MSSIVSSSLPGPSGECGKQHNYASCLPMLGRSCCSINGFCGSNETYCLVSNGCQSGCVDPSVFGLPPDPTSTSSISKPSTTTASSSTSQTTSSTKGISSSTSLSQNTTITSSTSSPTAAPAKSSGLSGGKRIGAIVGPTVGGALLLLIACIILYRRRRRSPAPATPLRPSTPVMEEPRGYHTGLNAGSGFQVFENGDARRGAR